MSKGKSNAPAGGAVRKETEDGAKAPDSPVVDPAAPVVDPAAPVVDSKEAEKKEKEATRARDRRAKEKKEKEEKEAAEALTAKRCGYYIKPGLAITSRKGIVAGAPKGSDAWEGDKVTLEHFSEEVGARLFESGAIVEVK
jgi:hypothetical protein